MSAASQSDPSPSSGARARVTIRHDDEITGIRRAGIAVRDVLRVLERCVEPGSGPAPTPARVLLHGLTGERTDGLTGARAAR
jgi:hypothetical protein